MDVFASDEGRYALPITPQRDFHGDPLLICRQRCRTVLNFKIRCEKAPFYPKR